MEVRVTLGQVANRPCYFIANPASPYVRKCLGRVQGLILSAKQDTYYCFVDEMPFDRLFKNLRTQGFYVDYSQIGPEWRNRAKKDRATEEIATETTRLLDNYKRYLRGLRLSERTISVYGAFVRDFIQFCGDKPVHLWGNNDVRFFVEQQVERKNYAVSSHRQLIGAIKHLGGLLPKSALDTDGLPRPSRSRRLPTVLSKEEVIELIRCTANLKHRATLALLYSSGLRVGEVIGLELRDLDIDRRQVFVRQGKGRKDRVVILAQSFLPLLQNYLMTYRPQRYFIEGKPGLPYTAGSIRNFLKRSSRRAGIRKRVSPHTLRHSFATHLIENGVGVMHVQQLLGHAKPETTMVYTHIAQKDLLQIRSPLDATVEALSQQQKQDLNQSFSQNLLR